MKIALTGATGLLGRSVAAALQARGDSVIPLARRPGPSGHRWDALRDPVPEEALFEADGVIHLSGENIGEGRWTRTKKGLILDSRVRGTRSVVQALAQLPPQARPKVFVSASAVGIYGNRGDELLSERSETAEPTSFLAQVCHSWEHESTGSPVPGVRHIALRFGVILSKRGGALAPLTRLFRLGMGGPIADGSQWMSWIHIDDAVRAVLQVLERAELQGPVNATSPNPVRQREFAKTLGSVLDRPALLPTPALGVKLALGEKSVLALQSQRVLPEALLRSGFEFRFPQLREALRDLLGGGRD